MNYNQLVLAYINTFQVDEPIFIENIKEYIAQFCKEGNIEKVYENVNVILNRLNKENIIKTFYKGIYYKPVKNIFGEMPLDKNKVIEKKYLKDKNGNRKGYVTGAKLFNQIGLTTQVPNIINIVTNECKNYNDYKNEYLNVVIRKPRIEINDDNYRYIQLFDIINNRDYINIETENIDEVIYQFIQDYELDFEKIIKYARETNNKKVLETLYVLAR